MNLLKHTIAKIEGLDESKMQACRQRVDSLIKPLNSLGNLEDIAVQLSGITKEVYPKVDQKAIIVMAGDHGVYAEGVSGNPQAVTKMQTSFFPQQLTGVCAIAKVSNAEVIAVDVGVKGEFPPESGVLNRKVKNGTGNIARELAMTRAEAVQALEVGIEVAEAAIAKGVNLLGIGEMGIANTTPTTAIVSVIGNVDAGQITGRGAGTGEGGIDHKAAVIRKAIQYHQPDANDGLDILSKIGGLEIAGMAGVILAAAANRVPVVIDGYISSAAALIAYLLEPKSKAYMISSHLSLEPGAKLASKLLGLKPYIHMNLCLGEGSGGALFFPMIDAAISMINHMATFEDVGMTL